MALVVGVVATAAAPGRSRSAAAPVTLRPTWFFCDRSRPLLGSAVLIGFGSSVWWSFSVDALRAAGTAPDTGLTLGTLTGPATAGLVVTWLGYAAALSLAALACLAAVFTAPSASLTRRRRPGHGSGPAPLPSR